MKLTITSLAFLAVLGTAQVTAAAPEQQPDARNAPIDCLADLPPLKGVSMRISEQAFLDILKSQRLSYTSATRDGETTYLVKVRKDAVVLFGFREGYLMSLQRSNGLTFG